MPAQGPGQEKLLRKFVGPPRLDGLAKSLITQHIEIERSSRFITVFSSLSLLRRKILFPVFHPRPYIEKNHLSLAAIFPFVLWDFAEKSTLGHCSKNIQSAL
ncbi:hypothetical protein [Pseudomonas sp. GM74]|uniref:hypothetical protein n=1 Tax=Pseudomonas sp. GM74 TaxID=1144336 RepID=UPI0012F9AF0A|nr:hypothetical protein [Pseudomonas sp. GM74]